MSERNLGDAHGAPQPGDDNEQDVLNTFHVYTPTPGDFQPGVTNTGSTAEGSMGSILAMGATMPLGEIGTNTYTGIGLRTYGHIFLDGRGAGTEPDGLPTSSRVTIQTLGRLTFQSTWADIYALSGGAMVSASNADHYVTSYGGLTLAGGWCGANPKTDVGPGNAADPDAMPVQTADPNYLSYMSGLGQFWNVVDGLSGTFFAYKFAADFITDVRSNDAPDAIGDVFDQVTQTASASLGAIGAGKSLHDATAGGGPDATNAPVVQAPTGSGKFPTPFGAVIGDGVNIFGEGGIIMASPVSIDAYAGAGMSLGSINNTIWGVDTEMYGAAQSTVSSFKDVKIKAGGEVKIASRKHLNVMSREGDIGVRARRVQIGYVRNEGEVPTHIVDAHGVASTAATLTAAGLASAEGIPAIAAFAQEGDAQNTVAWTVGTAVAIAALGAGAAEVLRESVQPPPGDFGPPSGAPPGLIRNLNDDMPDFVSAPSGRYTDEERNGPVVKTASESPRQSETEDVFIKAKSRIRLKSHEAVDIGAACDVKIRVGPMIVYIHADSYDSGSVVIGQAGMSGSPAGPIIKIDASSTTGPVIELKASAQTGIKIDGLTDRITLRAGGSEFHLDNSQMDAQDFTILGPSITSR